MVDGSIVRVHQNGAPKRTEQDSEAVGKSRGGLSAKIHAVVDALGNPIRLILTAGQASEYGQFSIDKGVFGRYVLADKGYDSNEFVAAVKKTKAEPVIPPKKNRLEQRHYDKELYNERNLVG